MNRILTCFILCVFASPIYAQFFNVEGEFRHLPAQGMAIYGNKCFMLNITGYCRVYDLKEKKIVSDFRLGCYSSKNHANSASFGIEKIGKSKRPVMYVSECLPPYRCFVENISDSGSILVQTIQAVNNGKPEVIHDWVVDRKNHYLYGIKTTNKEVDSLNTIMKYKLPRLSEGDNVILTEEDKIDQYDLFFVNILQGATIKNNRLFLPVGIEKGKDIPQNQRVLIVVDLKKRCIERKIDITNVTEMEPEDCDFYKGKLLLYCGQSGGLYVIPTK